MVFINRYLVIFVISCLLIIEAAAQGFSLDQDFASICNLQFVNGVSVADYDQDGDLDLYVISIHEFDSNDDQTWSRLLQNDTQNGFKDVSVEADLFGPPENLIQGWLGDRMAASWGDYNNDGYPDLFISNYGFDKLWRNEGNGKFTDVSFQAGIIGCNQCYSTNGLWWDYDLDGDLDLYVSDWTRPNRLYKNNGNGKFTDVSTISGLADEGRAWSSLPIDVNNDYLPDLYVVNDFDANFFYVNEGNGQFREATEEYGLENEGDGMGVTVSDFNGDGQFDIYITNIFSILPNAFFVSNEQGTYTDRAAELHIDNTGWGWGARFFDYDHDTDEDLYVVNGMNLPNGHGDENFFFENHTSDFLDISNQLGVNNDAIGKGVEAFDYDMDGDLDLVVGNWYAPMSFYKNMLMESEGPSKNWLQIKLEGTTSNKNGFGSVVEITSGGEIYRRLYTGVNIFGQSILPVHFGLSESEGVDEIAVIWPTGTRENFGAANANQIISIKEGDGTSESTSLIELSETDYKFGVNVFPNPFFNSISIEFSKPISESVDFLLSDIHGKIVYSEIGVNQLNQTLDLQVNSQGWKPGIYIYQIKAGQDIINGKIVFQR